MIKYARIFRYAISFASSTEASAQLYINNQDHYR